jgi:hypothetical protein
VAITTDCRAGACVLLPDGTPSEECAISVVASTEQPGRWRVIVQCHERRFDRWSEQRESIHDNEHPSKIEAMVAARQAQRCHYNALITVYDL